MVKQTPENLSAAQALARGYSIINRAQLWASRIDRKDWRLEMVRTHVSGAKWLDALGPRAADHYRRYLSKDVIYVPRLWIDRLPNSHNGPAEFKP